MLRMDDRARPGVQAVALQSCAVTAVAWMLQMAPVPLMAQQGVVSGRVVEARTGAPVATVAVRLETGHGVLTDPSGRFLLREVPAGQHRIEVTGIGWASWADDALQIGAGETVSLVIRLRREAVPLPEIIVSPGTFGMLEAVSPGAARTITRDEIEVMPQLGEDVFRSLTRLPGVSAHDISTRLNVRGSQDREVMVRLDGLELHEPYHLKDWDGIFGIVDLTALSGVELKTGGFGVEYGDRAAGVLDMKSRTAVGPVQTTVGLNVSHLSALSQGGVANDKGSWLLSGRVGSLGLLMKMVGADDRLSPQYYDVFGKVAYGLGPGHLLSLNVLHAGDRFHLDVQEEDGAVGPGIEAGRVVSDWTSTYAWGTWEAPLGRGGTARTLLWTGEVGRLREGSVEDLGSVGTPEQVAVRDERTLTFVGVREHIDLEVTPDLMLRIGGEVLHSMAEYDYDARTGTPVLTWDGAVRLGVDTLAVAMEPTGDRVSAFTAVRGRVRDVVTVEAGVRYDRLSHTDETHLSPRIQASVQLSPSTTLQSSAGRYLQPHGLGELQVGDVQAGYAPAERSSLFAIGLQQSVGNHLRLRAEAYDRRIADQQPRFVGLEQQLGIFPEQQGDRLYLDALRGRMRGLELFLEGTPHAGWSWSASYALAQAEDEVPQAAGCQVGPTCLADPWVPRARDQRHAVNLQLEVRPTRSWRLAAAWIFHTGWPATEWVFEALPLASGWLFWTRGFGPLNGERLPAYHRLDIRATRSFRAGRGDMDLFVDLFNVYDRSNRASYEYAASYGEGGHVTTARTDGGEELLPFLPMFGLRYRF